MREKTNGEKREFTLKVLFLNSSKRRDFGVVVEATSREEALLTVLDVMGTAMMREMFTIANHNAPGISGFDVEYITIDQVAKLK